MSRVLEYPIVPIRLLQANSGLDHSLPTGNVPQAGTVNDQPDSGAIAFQA